MAKFLVLGVSSFYGKNFAALCLKKGDEVIGLSRPEWDLRKPLPKEEFDYIVNFCSLNRVPESWKHYAKYAQTNVELTTGLFYRLRRVNFKKFIHVSTPEVYGSSNIFLRENVATFAPSTPYAVTRAAADMMLKVTSEAFGFNAIITRTANIYGPGQQDYRLIPKALACKKDGKPFPLEGGGMSVRSWIHVEDACEATHLVAMKGEVGTYHISTNLLTSTKDIVEMLEVSYEITPERLGKDYCYAMSSEKLRALGWQDRILLREGLEQCKSAL